MDNNFDEQKALDELEKGYNEAEKLLHDQDKMERFLQRLEKKLKTVPLAGNKLAVLPISIFNKKLHKKGIYRYSDRHHYFYY